MRLSEWRTSAPNKEAISPRVSDLIDPVLLALGSDPDPDCWVAWGEEPAVRYTILVPIAAGLIVCYVRVNVAGEGPRTSAKLIRWNRVQLGELAIETQAAHRLVSFQVDQQVLRGADDMADRVGAFAMELFAAVDGRPMPARPAPGRPAAAAAAPGTAAASGAAKSGSDKTPGAKTPARKTAAARPSAATPAGSRSAGAKPASASSAAAPRRSGPSR
jgi:hypothetical protein